MERSKSRTSRQATKGESWGRLGAGQWAYVRRGDTQPRLDQPGWGSSFCNNLIASIHISHLNFLSQQIPDGVMKRMESLVSISPA